LSDETEAGDVQVGKAKADGRSIEMKMTVEDQKVGSGTAGLQGLQGLQTAGRKHTKEMRGGSGAAVASGSMQTRKIGKWACTRVSA